MLSRRPPEPAVRNRRARRRGWPLSRFCREHRIANRSWSRTRPPNVADAAGRGPERVPSGPVLSTRHRGVQPRDRLAPVQVLGDGCHQLVDEAIEWLERVFQRIDRGTIPSPGSCRPAYPQMRPSARAAVSAARPPRSGSRRDASCGRRSCRRPCRAEAHQDHCDEADECPDHDQVRHQQQLHPTSFRARCFSAGAGAPPRMEEYAVLSSAVRCG